MPRLNYPKDLYGIIGFPLDHSLSPLLHNWAFEKTEQAGVYLAWPIEPRNLDAFILSMHCLQIKGCSVTLPHKQRIIPFLDEMSPEARHSGAINTLFWKQGELWGANTDIQGFKDPLLQQGLSIKSALILGAGGAALSCVHALKEMLIPTIYVAARDLDKVAHLQQYGVIALKWEERTSVKAEVLINATPLGLAGSLEYQLPLPEQELEKFQLVYDLVYNPLRTKLLSEAEKRKVQTLSGLHMFVRQAQLQFELWTGHVFPLPEALALCQSCLGR